MNVDVWTRVSPIYNVAGSTTPSLLLHGEGEPPESRASRVFYNALKQHYKSVEYKTYPGNNYYVSSVSGLQDMYEDLLDFFHRYVGAGAALIDSGAKAPRVLSREEREHPQWERRLGRVAHL